MHGETRLVNVFSTPHVFMVMIFYGKSCIAHVHTYFEGPDYKKKKCYYGILMTKVGVNYSVDIAQSFLLERYKLLVFFFTSFVLS